MINKDSDYGTMQPEYNGQRNQFRAQPGRMAASAAQAGEESSASQGAQGPQTLNDGSTHFNQPGRGSSGGTREALTSPAALPSVLPPERDAKAVDLVSRPAQASSRFQDRKGEQTHSENMEGYAFAMHDPGRMGDYEPISAAKRTFDGADDSPGVRGNQPAENRPGYDTQAGYATTRAAGQWGQSAGRKKGRDTLRQTKGRKFPQDPFSIADEQEAQVQQMRRTMRTHRPGLRKVFAGADPQRQRAGKIRGFQENANSLESWGRGQDSNASVNQARAGGGSRNPGSLSNRGSPFRFPAKGLNHKALLSAVRGQKAKEGSERTERGPGAAHIPPFRQEQGDFSELQIIAPNQRAMMNKPHLAKLAATTGFAHRKASMPANKIESSASIQRAAMIEAVKNRPMIQIPRHDHVLFHNERENAAKYHLELVAVGKQNGQQDLGPAALASSDRSSLINDLNGQDAYISITPPQKGAAGKLRMAPAPAIGSSFVRHEDLTANPQTHQYGYPQQHRVRVQDESKIEMRRQLGAGIVRPQVDQVDKTDQQDCSEFMHLNEKTRLELLQARGQSPRLPEGGSRSKSPRQGASSTGTGQHEQGSSGNCSRMQSTILRAKHANESQPHRNGQRIEQNAIKQSWNTQLDEKSWSPGHMAKMGGFVGPGPQELDLSTARQYQMTVPHDNAQKVECLTSGHEIDRPKHFNEVPIEDSNNSQVLLRKYGNEDFPMRDNSGIANQGQALPALLAASQRHQTNPSPRRRPKGAALHTISSGLPDSEHAANPRAERILAPLGDLSSTMVSVVLTGQAARAYRHPTAAKPPPGQRRMPGNQPFRRTFQVEFVAASATQDKDLSISAADEGARVQQSPEKGALNNLQPSSRVAFKKADTVGDRGSGSGSQEGRKIQNPRELEDLGGDGRSPMLPVAKINRTKRHGTITDERDPVYRIVEERSVGYGKGAGGGGGKYLVGGGKAGAASPRRVSPGKDGGLPNRAPTDRQQGHNRGASLDWPKRSSEQSKIQQKLTAVYQMNQQISQMQQELAWNQTMKTALHASKNTYNALEEVSASFADHYSGSIQQIAISEADACPVPSNTTMPKVNQRIREKTKVAELLQLTPKPQAGPSRARDPNLYDPRLRHDTNGYAVDIVTAAHESIAASQMLDRRDRRARVLDSQFMQKQMGLSKGFDVTNPAKRIKDRLRSKRHTKDILFGEFDSFKNWDTRIVLEDDAAPEARGTAGP